MGRLSLMVLACIAAFSSYPVGARDFTNFSFPITQAGPLDPSSTVPGLSDESPTSTCSTYSPCNIFYQYVSIFYWPTESQNTACLSSLPSPPPAAITPGFDVTSPSIYAIFPSVIASDGCNLVGSTYKAITGTFAPGDLSTFAGDSYSVFNFADLPCPPPGVEVRPGSPYAPLISPPPLIFDLDPSFSGCVPGKNQGVDPPYTLTSTVGAQGPGPVGHVPRRRELGARAHAPVAPWAPTKTAEPARRNQI